MADQSPRRLERLSPAARGVGSAEAPAGTAVATATGWADAEELRARQLQAAFATSPIKRASPARPTVVAVRLPSASVAGAADADNADAASAADDAADTADAAGRPSAGSAGGRPSGESAAASVGRGSGASAGMGDGGEDTMGVVTVLCCTWNMNNLTSLEASFAPMLWPEGAEADRPDVVVLGAQECGLDRRAWQAKITEALGDDYELLCMRELMPIKLCVCIRSSLRPHVSDVESADIPLKLGGALKTKGAVGMSMKVAGASFLFINSHLPAHQSAVRERNQAYRAICDRLPLPHRDHLDQALQLISTPSRRARMVSVVDRFEHVFWLGDLNYRIDAARDEVEAWVNARDFASLRAHDQLRREMASGAVFQGFSEGELDFRPTYKYDRGTCAYDTSEKRRVPAWTDRVLFKTDCDAGAGAATCLSYAPCDALRESDHRPVVARFAVDIPRGRWRPRDVNSASAADLQRIVQTARRMQSDRDGERGAAEAAPAARAPRRRSRKSGNKAKSAICAVS